MVVVVVFVVVAMMGIVHVNVLQFFLLSLYSYCLL